MTVILTSGNQAQAQTQDPSQDARSTLWSATQSTEKVVPNYGFTTAQPEVSVKSKSWTHLVAGGVGGMMAALFTSPLDVLKTRLQSDFYQSQLTTSRAIRGLPHPESLPFQRLMLLHVRETFQILFSIHRIEGWRALFKGLGPNLTGIVPASAIKFYTYNNCKQIISTRMNGGQEGAWVHLLAAATAGVVVSTATNPIWVVKTRLQLDKSRANNMGSSTSRQYKGSLDCALQVLQREGIKGMYRGLSASYLGVTESTLQWVLYEQMKMYLAKREKMMISLGRKRTVWDQFADWGGKVGAAGSAKLFAALITYPHEVVRTRLRQAPMENGRQKYTGLLKTFQLIWKEEGLASMYGGMTPHLLRVVPSSAIMFGTYEVFIRIFDRNR